MPRADQLDIIILGDIIAKKNSKQIRRRKNIPFIASSNAWERYEKQALLQLLHVEKYEGSYPVIIEMYFYRATLRRFDLDNMISSVQDLLVKSGIIEDDTMKHVIPRIKNLGWDLDGDNPRTEIKIIRY